MKVVIEKEGNMFYVSVINSAGCYIDNIETRDHDELLSLLIETLNLNYP